METAPLITLNQLASSSAQHNITLPDEMAIVTLRSPFEKVDYPFRLDGMVIGIIKEGEGRIGIDLREYELRPGSLLVIHPRNYVYSGEGDSIVVDIIACSSEVVENVLPKLTDLMPLLIHHRAEPVERLSSDEVETLLLYHTLLQQQYSSPSSPFKKKKMLCLLQSVLFEMLDIQCRHEEVGDYKKTRKEEIMAQFIILVSENFREQRQLSFYADELCVSSKHLSSVVKEISGRTAGEWIENYVTAEAKVLLRTTDFPIQEIASRLNFTNQSFFGKYFKHQTGMSPSDYRKSEQ